MTSFVRCANSTRSSRSHYDIIHIVTSFATELATPTIMNVRYVCMDTLPHLIYKDSLGGNNVPSHVGTFAPSGEYD